MTRNNKWQTCSFSSDTVALANRTSSHKHAGSCADVDVMSLSMKHGSLLPSCCLCHKTWGSKVCAATTRHSSFISFDSWQHSCARNVVGMAVRLWIDRAGTCAVNASMVVGPT